MRLVLQTADALAAYRLTRLALDDDLTRTPRDRLVAYLEDNGHHALVDVLGCYWCASVWVAAGVVAARRLAPRAWDPVARVLSVAAIAALIAHGEHQATRIGKAAKAWEETR